MKFLESKIQFKESRSTSKILVTHPNNPNNYMSIKMICGIIPGSILLILASCVPALFQMAFWGWEPPISIPFGITVDKAREQTASIVWIDARSQDVFQLGHIMGALDLNRDNWEAALPHLFELYSPGKVIIVYCSTGCTESEQIADRIRGLGLEPTEVLEGGYEAWQKANPAK